MTTVLWAIGLVLALEGLALALAPSRMEDALRLLAGLTRDQRRGFGLVALAIGIGFLWLARLIGG